MKRVLFCMLVAAVSAGSSCPSGGLPIDPLAVTPALRDACSTLDGIPLDDAYLEGQLIAMQALFDQGVPKPMAIEMSRVACIERINAPCDGIVCTDDDDLPLSVNCGDCSAEVAHQIYGDIINP